MADTKSTLYSLLPLILIILFSWLFGKLGSKMKKPTEETDASAKGGPEDQPLDIFSVMREAAGRVPPPQGGATVGDRIGTSGAGVRLTEMGSGGPRVTPTPITPKWWGA